MMAIAAEFIAMIETVETDLGHMYLPDAIQFIDDKYDGAWSKEIEKADQAIIAAHRVKNLEQAKMAVMSYKHTIERFITEFKQNRAGGEVENFLREIEGEMR